MTLRIGSTAPDFEADTTQGPIRFHEWLGNSWGILFSHPKDFTPVCTTELGYLAKLQPEFDKRNTKVIGLSVDPVEDHKRWLEDINRYNNCNVQYPIIGDEDLEVSKLYDMFPEEEQGGAGRTAATNQTVRTVYLIGPDKQIKATLNYPMSTGRNFDEVLRLLDSCQLTAEHKVATPVNWRQGEECIIVPSVSDEEAKQRFPSGWKTELPYLRKVPQPGLQPTSQSQAETEKQPA
jgi:thioredoxin-dependent peroxiredoxin